MTNTRNECGRLLPFGVTWREPAETGFRYCSAMPKTMRLGRLAGQTRRLLRCGIWAGPVFTATFLAEGAARDGYRPLRQPVSSLALGPRGWVQTVNFAVTGVLCLAGAAGLHRTGDRLAGSRAGPIMAAAAGAGLIGSAVFHHGAGRSGFRPVIPAGRLRRPVPAGQHHHRLRLAHGRVGARTPAHIPWHRRNILICALSRGALRESPPRGSRATSAVSHHHVARPTFQNVSEPSAE